MIFMCCSLSHRVTLQLLLNHYPSFFKSDPFVTSSFTLIHLLFISQQKESKTPTIFTEPSMRTLIPQI